MFLKLPEIIIIGFGENNVYIQNISIYMNFRGVERLTWSLYIFVYYSKKWKKYKSMTYTKIKFPFILIEFFSGMNNEKFFKKVGL